MVLHNLMFYFKPVLEPVLLTTRDENTERDENLRIDIRHAHAQSIFRKRFICQQRTKASIHRRDGFDMQHCSDLLPRRRQGLER